MRWFDAMLWLVCLAFCVGGCGKPALKESTRYHAEAMEALAQGNTDLAIEKLSQSIADEPTVGCLFDRAKLYESLGDDEKAMADCDQGLGIEPDNEDLKWLKRQLDKPKAQRFQGAEQFPPRATK